VLDSVETSKLDCDNIYWYGSASFVLMLSLVVFRDTAVAPLTSLLAPSEATPSSPAKPVSSASPTCSVTPQLLLQAIKSHLHFSQIRSWQEVGMSDHTHSPFQLSYNVCVGSSQVSDMATKFVGTSLAPVLHTFPLISIAGITCLQVAVWSLPRLHSIPQQLHSCSGSLASVTCSNSNSSGQESFPFSPPTPSPLSPKLLSGLADRLAIESSLSGGVGGWSPELKLLPVLPSVGSEALVKVKGQSEERNQILAQEVKETSDRVGVGVAAPQGACGLQVTWSPSSQVDSLASGLSSLRLGHSETNGAKLPTFEPAPRAPGSPAPFSAACDSSTTAKRRSCALSCKVRAI